MTALEGSNHWSTLVTVFDIAVYALDVMLIGILLYLVRLEYMARHVAALFWATILGIYALPALTDPLEAYAPLEGTGVILALRGNPVLWHATAFAIMFAGFYLLVRKATLKRVSELRPDVQADAIAVRRGDPVEVRFVLFLAAAAVVGCISGIWAVYSTTGVNGLLSSGYQSFRLTADTTFVRIALYLLAAGSGGVYLAWRMRKWTLLVAIVSAVLLYFLLSFARQILMFMVVPFAIHILYSRGSFSRTIALAALGVSCYYVLIFLCALRYRGSNVDALEGLFNGEIFRQDLPDDAGEARLRYVYYFFVENPQASASVIPGQTYFRLLMLPLPSEYSFGLKPGLVDINLWYSFYAHSPVDRDVEGASLHALIFGDTFANFGAFGVLVGALWAFVAHWCAIFLSRVPRVVRMATYGPLGFCVLGVARGSVYNSCAYFFWCTVIIVAIYAIAKATVSAQAPERGVPPAARLAHGQGHSGR